MSESTAGNRRNSFDHNSTTRHADRQAAFEAAYKEKLETLNSASNAGNNTGGLCK